MVLIKKLAMVIFCCGWLPAGLTAQALKTNTYDKFLKQHRLETLPVVLKAGPAARMSLSLRAADTSFFLQLQGSGVGTNTVDVGNTVVLRLSNGDSVVAYSPDVQSFDYATAPPRYRHEYRLPYTALEQLSRAPVVALRKQSAGGFDNFTIEAKAGTKVAALAEFFLREAKTAKLVPDAKRTQPSFPGGVQTWLAFLARNVKADTAVVNGAELTAAIRLVVAPTGEVTQMDVSRSANNYLTAELLRVLRRMPRWKPALQNGTPVEATVEWQVLLVQGERGVQVSLL